MLSSKNTSRWWKPLFVLLLPIVFLVPIFSRQCPAQDWAQGVPSASSETGAVHEFEIEGTSLLEKKQVLVGESFSYTLTLSWAGRQEWISLEPPEVAWPSGVEQVDVRTRTASRVGPDGPIGEKSFVYDLTLDEPGSVDLPDIDIEVLFHDHTSQTITIPGKTVSAEKPPVPASERVRNAIRENKWILGGVGVLLLAAFGFAIYSVRRKKSEDFEEGEDPWEPIQASLEKCEALRKAGQDREFYGQVEATLISACALASGSTRSSLRGFLEEDSISETGDREFSQLVEEIEERKYRPDRPRPEEMQRTYKQARSVLSNLKLIHRKKGQKS